MNTREIKNCDDHQDEIISADFCNLDELNNSYDLEDDLDGSDDLEDDLGDLDNIDIYNLSND